MHYSDCIDAAAFGWLWPGTPSHAHTRPDLQHVITCSYLEVHKDVKEGTICYTEQKKKAIISTYCVGVCPALEIHQEKGQWIHAGYVFSDTNEAILGLLSEEIIVSRWYLSPSFLNNSPHLGFHPV